MNTYIEKKKKAEIQLLPSCAPCWVQSASALIKACYIQRFRLNCCYYSWATYSIS